MLNFLCIIRMYLACEGKHITKIIRREKASFKKVHKFTYLV